MLNNKRMNLTSDELHFIACMVDPLFDPTSRNAKYLESRRWKSVEELKLKEILNAIRKTE